jgi:hypothetical protein
MQLVERDQSLVSILPYLKLSLSLLRHHVLPMICWRIAFLPAIRKVT